MSYLRYFRRRVEWLFMWVAMPWVVNRILTEENKRLAGMVANPLLTGINMGNGSVEIGLKGGAAELIAGMFVGMFEKHDAKNYIEIKFSSKIGPVCVTVQRLEGETPVHQLRKAQSRLTQLAPLGYEYDLAYAAGQKLAAKQIWYGLKMSGHPDLCPEWWAEHYLDFYMKQKGIV